MEPVFAGLLEVMSTFPSLPYSATNLAAIIFIISLDAADRRVDGLSDGP